MVVSMFSMGWAEIVWSLVSLAGIFAFLAGTFFVVRSLIRGRGSALEVLEERFARGEIDEDEFLKRKATLST